jgi:hypothetical protein
MPRLEIWVLIFEVAEGTCQLKHLPPIAEGGQSRVNLFCIFSGRVPQLNGQAFRYKRTH